LRKAFNFTVNPRYKKRSDISLPKQFGVGGNNKKYNIFGLQENI